MALKMYLIDLHWAGAVVAFAESMEQAHAAIKARVPFEFDPSRHEVQEHEITPGLVIQTEGS